MFPIPRPSVPRSASRRHKVYFHCALGALSAGLLFDVALRPFVADSNHSGIVAVHTIRNYFEGLAVAHFEADGLGPLGNRLTGYPPLSGAPEIMIVGDSHVVAYAVSDQESMGAVVERLSRSAGRPLNVRQYGWPGANAPTFVAAAQSLLDARHPASVAVVLNSYNIGINALMTSNNWRMEIAPDDSFRLIEGRHPSRAVWRETMRQWTGCSVLALALWRRLELIRSRFALENVTVDTALEQRDPGLAKEAARVPRAVVLGLKKAYGERLIIVYTPHLLGVGRYSVEPAEMDLLRLCADQGVGFVSMREALARDRNDYSRLSRGFHNTAPGVGHFNAIGHRIIGEEIWRYLCAHSSFSALPQ
jgi:hypothetical protein